MMKHTGKIFSFTFLQHVRGKGYRSATVIVTLLCFLLPAVIMPAIQYFGGKDTYQSRVQSIYVADLDAEHEADYELLNKLDKEQFCNLSYTETDSVEEAVRLAAQDGYGLALVVEKQGAYRINVLLPEESELTKDDARAYEKFVEDNFRSILAQKSGLNMIQMTELTKPVEISYREYSKSAAPGMAEESDEFAAAKKIFSAVLPYLNIMILYFMVLAYGQGTANSAIMEKTSKLMDLFLVSVKPQEMLLGKVLAITASGILQLFCWIGGLVGGFAVGTYFTKLIDPQTDMALIQLFEAFGELSGMFTLHGSLLALLMLAAGLLLYCSLASVGGAMAGKPEDLSNTNSIFVLVLIASFFATMYSGGISADTPWLTTNSWQMWVPFTAILIMPTKMILGSVTLAEGLLSTAIVIAAAVVITMAAGRLYRMMSLYKGNPPGPAQILKLIKQSKQE
ncbi:MAG: ABC transporter permease [Eubacteriales bacterium]|nr:ABC transporter permease [Eubacteriales bacterium]